MQLVIVCIRRLVGSGRVATGINVAGLCNVYKTSASRNNGGRPGGFCNPWHIGRNGSDIHGSWGQGYSVGDIVKGGV